MNKTITEIIKLWEEYTADLSKRYEKDRKEQVSARENLSVEDYEALGILPPIFIHHTPPPTMENFMNFLTTKYAKTQKTKKANKKRS